MDSAPGLSVCLPFKHIAELENIRLSMKLKERAEGVFHLQFRAISSYR